MENLTTLNYTEFERWAAHAQQLGYQIASMRGPPTKRSRWLATHGDKFMGYYSLYFHKGELDVADPRVLA